MTPQAPIKPGKQYAPATLRNRDPILAVLKQYLPQTGSLLEIASGSGEHAAYFAPQFPELDWQPSDPNPAARNSITAWQKDVGHAKLYPPLDLDVSATRWWDHLPAFPSPLAAMVCINMIHISPWVAGQGLLQGAGQLLPAGGILYLYGPYHRRDIATAPSNLAFDQQLQQQNPLWGLRLLEDVIAEASEAGLMHIATHEMPANNLSVIFRR